MLKQSGFFIILQIFLFSQIHAQDSTISGGLVQAEVSYIADNLVNLNGGIQTGYSYLGMANLQLGLETEAARLWKGGQLFLHVAATHGGTPSEKLIGDLQIVSNIEAGNHLYVQELWYRHSLGNTDITIGLQDMNVRFFSTETSQLLINSSFGVIPSISGNLPVSIFPLTTPGITFQWNMSERSSIIAAIHDGMPYDFEDNPYNLRWSLNEQDGAIAALEYQFTDNRNGKKGYYNLGAVTRRASPPDANEEQYRHRSVLYFKGEREMFQSEGRIFSLLGQAALCPDPDAPSVYCTGFGMHIRNPFLPDGGDELALAISHDVYNFIEQHETAIELTYSVELTKTLKIQPDLQYIINPAGIGIDIPNSLIGIIRLTFSVANDSGN